MSCTVSSTTSSSTNMDTSSQDTIIVSVRIRPENSREHGQGYPVVVQMIDSKMLVFDPKPVQHPTFGEPVANKRVKGRHKHKDLTFAFDNVFGESSTQREIFDQTTRKVVSSVLDGINCSIFAYGATGAGKTHTMLGTAEQPGIIYQTMKELYYLIEEQRNEISCDIAVTYLEIYNENIYDLLKDDKRCLPLREDSSKKSPVITGISYFHPTDAQDLLRILSLGNKRRTQHPTDANAQSSRSHAVFQVYVHQKPRAAGTETQVTVAKLSLIDLAGSERATVTTNSGVRLREGANINRSLLALGNVINALATQKGIKTHVPYRDSKLTRLLKDSLGGNCRTVMIANISPSGCSFEDTYNTLRYADRAKQIKVNANRNVVNVQLPMHKYSAIIDDLKRQVNHLQEELRKPRFPALPNQTLERLGILKSSISDLFKGRLKLKRKQLDSENEKNTSMVSSARRGDELQLIAKFECQDAKLFSNLKGSLERNQERESDLQREICTLDNALTANSTELQEKYVELTKEFPNESSCMDTFHEFSNLAYETSSVRFEKDSLYHHNKLQYLLLSQQEDEINQKTELISDLVDAVTCFYAKLSSADVASEEDHSRVAMIMKSISKQKEVSWADQINETPAAKRRDIFPKVQCSPLTPNSNRKAVGSILCSGSVLKNPSLPTELSVKPTVTSPLVNNFFSKPLSFRACTPFKQDQEVSTPVSTYTIDHGESDNQIELEVDFPSASIEPCKSGLFKQSQPTSSTFQHSSDPKPLDNTIDLEEKLTRPRFNKRLFSNLSPTLKPKPNKRFASELGPSVIPSNRSLASNSLRLSKKLPTYAQLTIAAKSKHRKPVTSIELKRLKLNN